MQLLSSRIIFSLLAISIVPFVVGCDDNGPRGNLVSGTVKFQGNPIDEGSITFEDKTSGNSATSIVAAGGGYSLTLPPGDYQVWIEPPMITLPATADSPADEQPKEVANIPKKYRSAASSGLSARVSESTTTHDFDMNP